MVAREGNIVDSILSPNALALPLNQCLYFNLKDSGLSSGYGPTTEPLNGDLYKADGVGGGGGGGGGGGREKILNNQNQLSIDPILVVQILRGVEDKVKNILFPAECDDHQSGDEVKVEELTRHVSFTDSGHDSVGGHAQIHGQQGDDGEGGKEGEGEGEGQGAVNSLNNQAYLPISLVPPISPVYPIQDAPTLASSLGTTLLAWSEAIKENSIRASLTHQQKYQRAFVLLETELRVHFEQSQALKRKVKSLQKQIIDLKDRYVQGALPTELLKARDEVLSLHDTVAELRANSQQGTAACSRFFCIFVLYFSLLFLTYI